MSNDVEAGKSFWIGLGVITLVSLLITVYRLGSQPPGGDDLGVALSAVNYVESGQLGPTMWNHPALRNLFVYVSLEIFGPGVWGVKLWSVVFGVLSVPLLGGLAWRLFRNGAIALLAAFFLALDPVHIDFSRQGINDVYLAFFPLAGLYLVLSYRESRQMGRILAAGVMFGCGLASKWSVALQLAAAAVLIFYSIVQDRRLGPAERKAELLFIFVSLTLVPLTVYLLTFIPWFGRGYDIREWVELQGQMLLETTTHTGYRVYGVEGDQKAYEWFIRPVSHFAYILPPQEGFPDGQPFDVRILLAFGNPLVWLLVLPSVAWLFVQGFRRRNHDHLFAAALFIVSYLPFVAASRPIWVNTALAVIPYAFLAVAWSVRSLASRARFGEVFLSVYLVLVLLTTMPLYLLATGRGSDYKVLRPFVGRYLPGHGGHGDQHPRSAP